MEINLSNQDIYDFPRQYCFQKNVLSLMLENNNLTDLPKEIVNLKSLKKLNLANNNIIFNIHQKKWLEQLKNNNCLIYINNKNQVSQVANKKTPKKTHYDTSKVIKSKSKKESFLAIEKVAVHEIAEELGVTYKDIIEMAKQMGIEVISAQSLMTMEQAENLANNITNGEHSQALKVLRRGEGKQAQHVTLEDSVYDENGFNKDTSLPKDKYGHRREFYKLNKVVKSIEKPKNDSRKKAESLKIVNAKIPERKGLKIVKKRFDYFELDIPKIKSILPINDMHNQKKVILIYTQEKDFLNLTLVEHHNKKFVIIDNIFKDSSGLSEITTLINEFIYDEIEDEFTLSMSNVNDSHLNDIFFEDNKLKVSEASAKIINILKYEQEAVILIKDLVLEDNSNVTLSLKLTKSEFDDEIINFRKSALDVVKKIIATNKYTADNIDYIIGNEEALSILSIKNSLGLTFGKDIFTSLKKILNTDKLKNKGTK